MMDWFQFAILIATIHLAAALAVNKSTDFLNFMGAIWLILAIIFGVFS